MSYRKHGAKLFGLLAVMVLGVMAFAASAQAVAPGFLINKKPALLATVGAVQEGVSTMLVPGLNFELNCTAFTVDTGHIADPTHASAVLLYTGCTTLSITKLPEEIHCEVGEPIKAEATLLPAETTAGVFAVLAEKIKALILMHLPGTSKTVPCILPEDNTVTGEVCLKIMKDEKGVDTNDTLEPLVQTDGTIQGECRPRELLEGKEDATKTVKDVLKYGTQTVTLDAKAKLFLTGTHNGLTLGVSLF